MSRDQLVHLDEIAVSILECEGRDDSEVGERYHLIGDLLHAPVLQAGALALRSYQDSKGLMKNFQDDYLEE